MGSRFEGVSDDGLVAAATAGDERAFRVLVERHHGACKRYALNMLGDADDAADATQEAFVRAFNALSNYEPRERFRGWLFTILVNRCRSVLDRKAKRAGRLAVLESARATRSDPGSPILLRRDLDRALQRLSTQSREAFLLKYVDGLSYDEMAEITGASVSALKMRVARARTSLRSELKGGT